MPDGDGGVSGHVNLRLRGQEPPDLALGPELGREALGDDHLSLSVLRHTEILRHYKN
jgi:hypothetical protein